MWHSRGSELERFRGCFVARFFRILVRGIDLRRRQRRWKVLAHTLFVGRFSQAEVSVMARGPAGNRREALFADKLVELGGLVLQASWVHPTDRMLGGEMP